MNKVYLQIFLAILFFTGLQFSSVLAGDKIKIHLQQPPPNKLGVSDLWKLTLENITREDLTIYLEGTVTESKDGIIVEGQSKSFVVKPGKTSYGYNDFKNGSVSWKNNKYQEAIVRTGNAPSGSYSICVTAKLESGEVVGQENCIDQQIEITTEQQISLASPNDAEVINPEIPIIFNWIAPSPAPRGGNCTYTLRIVEKRGSQSPDAAMKENRDFFKRDNIFLTSFVYPIDAPKFELGKTYVWNVTSIGQNKEVTSSDVRSFSRQACGGLAITAKVTCSGNGSSIYNYALTFQNPADPQTDPTCIMTVTSITVSGIPFTLSGLPIVNPGQTIAISGTIGPTILTSGIFTISVAGPGFAGTWSIPFTLEVLPATPGSITGPVSVCPWQTGVVYSITPVSGATNYFWSVSGATIVSGQGSTSIILNFSITPANVCVVASNSCGSSTPNCKAITITFSPVLAAPIANTATGIQLTGFTANWTSVTGATGYYLDVATNSSFTSSLVSGYMGLATTYTMIGLICNTTYYYRVRTVAFVQLLV